MNRNILLLLALVPLSIMAQASYVSNVTAHQSGQNIVIEYDLSKTSGVVAYVSFDHQDYEPMQNITGDVGANVKAGHKKIVWNVLGGEEEFVTSDVRFLIETTEVVDPVRDICGNLYPVVKIGSQYWTAENMRCNKYDTKSEAYLERRYTVYNADIAVFTPYYTNASDRNAWQRADCAGLMTQTQISKLGYLYNWAAAVGVQDGQWYETSFDGNRQGICPNGWHVPSFDEWFTLVNYVTESGGNKLKSKSGWCDDGNGNDDYGFSVLPACRAYGNSIYSKSSADGPSYGGGIGDNSFFWTATADGENYARNWVFSNGDFIDAQDSYNKSQGFSVRCVKN